MMDEEEIYSGWKRILERKVLKEPDPATALQEVCDYISENMPTCDWAGIYLVDPEKGSELFLGPFAGEPTGHVRIAFGKGICGRAASKLETFIIEDVAGEENYLSCSPLVKSEIVVPVFHGGCLVGEIDLDSHRLSGFSVKDGEFLEWLADLVSGLVDRLRQEGGNT